MTAAGSEGGASSSSDLSGGSRWPVRRCSGHTREMVKKKVNNSRARKGEEEKKERRKEKKKKKKNRKKSEKFRKIGGKIWKLILGLRSVSEV